MQKTIKRIICAAMSAAMLFSSAYAADYGAKLEDKKIVISTGVEESGFGTFIYIFKGKLAGDKKIADFISADALLYAGGLIDEFPLPEDAEEGVYTVVFCDERIPSDPERKVYLLNADEEYINNAVKAVLVAANAEEMLTVIKEYNDKAYILNLDAAEAFSTLLFDVIKQEELDIKEEPAVSDLESAYHTAQSLYSLQNVQEAELAALLKENKTILGVDEDLDKYAQSIAPGIVSAVNAGADFSNLQSIKNLVREQLALAALNGAGSELFSTIDKYNDVFNVTYSSHKNSVSEYDVTKKLKGTVFTSKETVGSIVNRAIDAVYDAANSVSGSGSGSGGGSSSSGGSSGGGIGIPMSSIDKNELSQNIGTAAGFSDISGYDWANEAILYLSENNIMTGDGKGSFRPGDLLTREELVKIIIMSIGKGKIENAELSFDDVKDDWYKPYVETAYAKRIVQGMSDTLFGIGETVTRQDACVMLSRAADAYYKTFNKEQTLVDIKDFDDVSEYAKVSVDTLARAGIVSGFDDGTFKPNRSITRAEAAKIIYGCIKNLENE